MAREYLCPAIEGGLIVDWYPFFLELYAADTRHLSCLEHGAYRLLIDEYMRFRRPLPDAGQRLPDRLTEQQRREVPAQMLGYRVVQMGSGQG